MCARLADAIGIMATNAEIPRVDVRCEVAMPPTITPPRKLTGKIEAVLSTDGRGRMGFQSAPVERLIVDLEGIVGNRHRGWTRRADGRVPYLARGTVMRNERHITIVSVEDLAAMAERLDVARIDPRWIGANIVMSGIEHVSFLPRGTHVMLPGKAILIVTDQNTPCTLSGEAIMANNSGRPDIKLQFPKLARGLRGLVATVEHGGTIEAGMMVEARVPAQWIYPG